jgi:hypothetical protein
MINNWTKPRAGGHDGCMSASDAAPLPRLGEVFFDVRGESRSMRLSWYADTGVAVFSIWQGGTCTGTFRLPIADLPRMVEALQRGPGRGAGGQDADRMPRGRHGQERDPGLTRGPEPGHELAGPFPDDDGYDSAPAAGYRDSGPGRHGSPGGPGDYQRTAAYPGGGYADEPTGVYQGDLLDEEYYDEWDGGYSQASYPGPGYPEHREDPLAADDPTGPSGSAYPGGRDAPDYRLPQADPGYPAARPYVAHGARDDVAGERRAGGRQRSRRRDDGGLSSGSLPYDDAPSERERPGRAR